MRAARRRVRVVSMHVRSAGSARACIVPILWSAMQGNKPRCVLERAWQCVWCCFVASRRLIAARVLLLLADDAVHANASGLNVWRCCLAIQLHEYRYHFVLCLFFTIYPLRTQRKHRSASTLTSHVRSSRSMIALLSTCLVLCCLLCFCRIGGGGVPLLLRTSQPRPLNSLLFS